MHELEGKKHWEDWERLLNDRDHWERLHERLALEQYPWIGVLRQSHDVVDLNEGYQWRVDNRLDVFPVNARYHILRTGERGGFKKKTAVDDIEELLQRSPPFHRRPRRAPKGRRRRRGWNQSI